MKGLDFWKEPLDDLGKAESIFTDERSVSFLSQSAEDHRRAGSTVPAPLRENPGKTQAELMTDENIRDYLTDALALLDGVYAEFRDQRTTFAARARAIRALETGMTRLQIDIEYLRSIRRLPPLPDIDLGKQSLKKRYPFE